jgi:hypothetical protein
MTTSVLYQNPGANNETMRFVDGWPVFQNKQLESYFRLFPISIPLSRLKEFDGQARIFFPKEGASKRERELFQKAFMWEIQSRSCYRTFHFEALTT